MLIAELVRGRADRLTATDRRLVAVLQARPAEAAFWYAADLTEPLGLHQSAATRMAQRLGFEGYPQLRDALRQDYLAGDGPSQRVRGRLQRHPDDVLGGFVDDELAALSALPAHVTQSEIDDLAARIAAAGHVHLFAQGNATVLTDLLSRRLRRFGMRSTLLTGPRRDLAERLSTLEPGDLLLACAFRRVPAALPPVLEIAAEGGAYTALITDVLLAMSPQPDAILAAPRGGSDDYLSLTVPMALINALVLTIARQAPDRAIGSLDRLGSLLERFDT
ncbi:MurR/RpiR family transcriptional regulator [Microbacterium marinilacus]|uniref:MurR/RpiR family transcriptional regulator n=1 Tax=Microbacterium marinilacus TaxID=415209 RepID=A0ABP7B8R2_9MICO|nr:MurR/RpiR family transcriptional regulator [Microbacterium marinilacus]MBY0687425.1 MurR/RpiR family transcriptional regulator [Microbacterium marinilacus]